jgi:hypothetical protein
MARSRCAAAEDASAAPAEAVVALPLEKLQGAARRGRSRIVDAAEQVVERARLVAHNIEFDQVVELDGKACPALPVADELLAAHLPVVIRKVPIAEGEGLRGAHVHDQAAALKHDVQGAFAAGRRGAFEVKHRGLPREGAYPSSLPRCGKRCGHLRCGHLSQPQETYRSGVNPLHWAPPKPQGM